MNNKDKYKKLCKTETSIPLFLRDYWMDSVSNDWDVFLYEKNGEILGSFVYIIKRKFHLKYLSVPFVTQYSGIWIKELDQQKNEKKYSMEIEIMNYFIEKVNELNLIYYMQSFSPKIKNVLPYYWNKYKISVNYTFVIDTTQDIDIIRDNIAPKTRGLIKNAEKKANIFECNDPKLFYDYLKKTYERQNDTPRISYDAFLNFDAQLEKNKSRFMIGAKDNDGNIHCICYFGFDDEKVYYLFSGSDEKYRNSNFNSVILWDAIKKSKQMGKNFDFEGSMNKNINSYMRKFGGELVSYYSVIRIITKNIVLKSIINRKLG